MMEIYIYILLILILSKTNNSIEYLFHDYICIYNYFLVSSNRASIFSNKKWVKMEEKNKIETTDIELYSLKINQKREVEKEEKIVNLIIEIILSATLKEYYEKSNKISEV
jgi:hypothetical protein